MKTVIHFTIAVFILITLGSCSKEYTCTCNGTSNGSTNELLSYTIYDSESGADASCRGKEPTYTAQGITVSCTIH